MEMKEKTTTLKDQLKLHVVQEFANRTWKEYKRLRQVSKAGILNRIFRVIIASPLPDTDPKTLTDVFKKILILGSTEFHSF